MAFKRRGACRSQAILLSRKPSTDRVYGPGLWSMDRVFPVPWQCVTRPNYLLSATETHWPNAPRCAGLSLQEPLRLQGTAPQWPLATIDAHQHGGVNTAAESS
ncbi:unnamed protein product [Arctogadus glacialis]